jgi:tRNA modification GTPase
VFSTSDTIVAIATPPGRGGIGVVRLSGPDAHHIACALIARPRGLQPRHATLTTVRLTPPRVALPATPATVRQKPAATYDPVRLKPDTTYDSRTTVGLDADVSYESASCGNATLECPTREPMTADPTTREPMTADPTTREPTTREPTRREPTPREHTVSRNAAREDAISDEDLASHEDAASYVVSAFPPSRCFGAARRPLSFVKISRELRRDLAEALAEAGSAERGGGRRTVADAIDQVVATYFPAPASYTGDEVVEISAHGSPVVLRAIVAAAIASGARLAEPGEFTLRAFLNGRIDLAQAEAIGDLIDAATPLQARAAFDQLQGTLTGLIGEIDAALFELVARLEASIDFPEEGYHFVEPGALASALDGLIERTDRLLADGARGRIVREGLQVAIVGKPNVGKSSIFNALVGTSRAIVTEVPGTTRDLLTEVIDLDGLRVTLVDTAGVRETADVIETEGVRRAMQAQAVADLLLVVLDGSTPIDAEDCEILSQTADLRRLTLQNKSDIEPVWYRPEAFRVSAATRDGIPALRAAICAALDVEPLSDPPEITNVRHIALVQRARTSMVRAREAAAGNGVPLSEEFVLADLQEARIALEEISGRRVPDDLLAHIFSKFCIGK